LSSEKFKDVVHPSAIEYRLENPGNKKNLEQKDFSNTMRNLLAAAK
jgi:hypothetical protein